MKANELTTGCYVLREDGTPVQITSIDETSRTITYFDGDAEGELELKLDKIKPIPLTPEILEKNGFEDIGDDIWQLTDRPYWFWIDFLNHRHGCEFDTSSYENEDSESRLYLYGIPDVHKLQQALKLCGIEKEIAL